MRRYVIDTNVFIQSISPASPYHLIFTSLTNGSFELCVSNEILLEYEEIISRKYSVDQTNSFLGFISFSPSVIKINPSYRYHLIKTDPDDNKFVDCAIIANADGIVTSDRHFNVLKNIEFPSIDVISVDNFIRILESLND
jgi:uncharacterized protein